MSRWADARRLWATLRRIAATSFWRGRVPPITCHDGAIDRGLCRRARRHAAPALRRAGATPHDRALADPLRIHLFELLSLRRRSAKELAALVEMPADRLYHHLAQLEEAGLIEVAEYRPLARGKVERIYAPCAVEPPGEDASPTVVAEFLAAVLEATRADILAASLAKEAGERREITLTRSALRLNETHLESLKTRLAEVFREAQEHPDADGVWTTVLWTTVDRQDRTATRGAGLVT